MSSISIDGQATKTGAATPAHAWDSEKARKNIRRRYGADRRLQAYGLIAIGISVLLLAVVLVSLLVNGYTAFVQTKVGLPVTLSADLVKPEAPADGNYRAVVRNALAEIFPDVTKPADVRELSKLLSANTPFIVRDYVVANPEVIGKSVIIPVPVSDPFDQMHKGVIPGFLPALSSREIAWLRRLEQRGLVSKEGGKFLLELELIVDRSAVDPAAPNGGNFSKLLGGVLQSYLPEVRDQGIFSIVDDRAVQILRDRIVADPSVIGKTIKVKVPLSEYYDEIERGESPTVVNPRFGKAETIEWFDRLVAKGMVSTPFSWELFTNADSRFPEVAGMAGGLVGSFFLMLVCFVLSFPIGIAAAVYLEEFAPKNRWTDLIEVNINNLAAVPSVVFGLLGLAVFLGMFGMPRSAPIVGGMVLSLMTLPTIIIATRAALKGVPPSIRQAALGVGASKHQVMTHHVLPLAMPGILTATIIGLAQALGETAPLLLIGMNAFIPSVENMGILQPATTLPTQIFSWADSPERGFVARTSAGILVLLAFLILMNGIAIYLRNKFERKW